MCRTLLTLACLTALSLTAACGNGNDTPDGGTDDGGGAGIGETCPGGDPLACSERICLSAPSSGDTYCSAYCDLADAASCPTEFPCQRYLFGDSGGNPADLRDVCAPPCNADAQCQSGVCEQPPGLCTSPARGLRATGEACGGAAGVCLENHVCQQVQAQLVCVPTCDPTGGPFCTDGSFCWSANVPRGGRCWPGGASEAADPCVDHLDCALGMLCILQNGESLCRVGCGIDGAGPACGSGAVCLPLEDRSYGFCQN